MIIYYTMPYHTMLLDTILYSILFFVVGGGGPSQPKLAWYPEKHRSTNGAKAPPQSDTPRIPIQWTMRLKGRGVTRSAGGPPVPRQPKWTRSPWKAIPRPLQPQAEASATEVAL